MTGFGSNPTTSTQGALATNQFPISTVAVPGEASGNLTALKGGPKTTDSNSNDMAPAATYIYDGNDVAQGSITDSAWSGSGSGTEIAILKKLVALLTAAITVSGSVTANAGTNTSTAALALETGGNLATLAGAITSAKVQSNTAQINGVTPLMGNGVSGTGVQRVTIASDSTGQVNQGGTWTAVPNAATTGGGAPYHLITANSTNATSVKASAGQVYVASVTNTATSPRYLKFYDKATAPTVGSDTVKYLIGVPPLATVVEVYPVGMAFPTGIALAITTGLIDSDTGVVGANELSIDLNTK